MNQRKAFIFDMDGVIINSEKYWDKEKLRIFKSMLGEKLPSDFIQKTKGIDLKTLFKMTDKFGYQGKFADYWKRMSRSALKIYKQAETIDDLDKLINTLQKLNYKLALVSGSPREWINIVLNRLSLTTKFNLILSVVDHPKLRSKPSPDSYLWTMKQLNVKPRNTIILEDSQNGIEAARKSGALVICLKKYHPKNYFPKGAKYYIENLVELLKLKIL